MSRLRDRRCHLLPWGICFNGWGEIPMNSVVVKKINRLLVLHMLSGLPYTKITSGYFFSHFDDQRFLLHISFKQGDRNLIFNS